LDEVYRAGRELPTLGVEYTKELPGLLDYDARRFVSEIAAWGTTMAKKITRSRPWTKEEVRMLKTRARADKDDRDRAQAQAERGCGLSAGIKAGRDARRRSREEEGVKGELVR
jgi:hypothetical protein